MATSAVSEALAASHVLDGDLDHRSYWTKKWRPRYFAVDSNSFVWFESEAIATAPGEHPPAPLGSVQLSDRLAVIVVDEADDIVKGDAWGGSSDDGGSCAEWDDALLPSKDRHHAVAALSVKPQQPGSATRSMLLLRGKNARAKGAAAAASTPAALSAESPPAASTSHSRSSLTEDAPGSSPAALLSPHALVSATASGTVTPASSSSSSSSAASLPTSSTGLSHAALRCAGGFLTGSYHDDAPSGKRHQHVLVLAHLPKASSSSTSAGGSALDSSSLLDTSAVVSSSSPSASSSPVPSSSTVTGAGAGLKEPLILSAESRRELQLWVYVLRSCCQATRKPLPAHIVAALVSRNESKALARRRAGLLERPFVVPITVVVPPPTPAPAPAIKSLPAPAEDSKNNSTTSSGANEQEGRHTAAHDAVSEAAATAAVVVSGGIPADHPDRQAMRATIYSYLKQRAEAAAGTSNSSSAGDSREKAAKLRHLEKVLAPRVEGQLYGYACITTDSATGAVTFDRDGYMDRSTLRQRIRRAFAEHRTTSTTTAPASTTNAATSGAGALPAVKEEDDDDNDGLASHRASVASATLLRKGESFGDAIDDAGSVDTTTTSSTLQASALGAPPPPPPPGRKTAPSPPPQTAGPVPQVQPPIVAVTSPNRLHNQHEWRPKSGSVAYSVGSVSTNALNGMRMVTKQRYGGPNVPEHPWASEKSPYFRGSDFTLKHYPPPDYEWEQIPVEKTAAGIPVFDATLIGRQRSDGDMSQTLPGAAGAAASTDGGASSDAAGASLSAADIENKARAGSRASSSSASSSSSSSANGQGEGANAKASGAGAADNNDDARSRSGSSVYPLQQGAMAVGASTASMRMTLVLDRRPAHPPPLPVLNKWQHRRCASCGVTQSTGLWGTLLGDCATANYCFFTELLFCSGKPKTQLTDLSSSSRDSMFPSSSAAAASTTCMAEQPRPIPWRVIHDLDATPLPVSRVAAAFIDRMWHLPLVALSAVAPATLAKVPALQRVVQLRARIADIVENAVVTAVTGAPSATSPAPVPAALTSGRSPSPGAGAALAFDDPSALAAGVLSPPSPSLAGSAGPSLVAAGGGAPGTGRSHMYRPSYYTRGNILPSEEPTPIDDAARRSASAAAMKERLLAIGRVHTGQSLGFMLNSVELLPLSLIVPLATSKNAAAKVIGRLTAAMTAIQAAVDDAATASIQQAFAAATSSASSHASPSASTGFVPLPPPAPSVGNPSPSAGSVGATQSRAIAINSSNYGRGPQLTANLNGAFGTATGASPTLYTGTGSLPRRTSLHTHSQPVLPSMGGSMGGSMGAMPVGGASYGGGPSSLGNAMAVATPGAHPYLRTATGNTLGGYPSAPMRPAPVGVNQSLLDEGDDDAGRAY